MRPRWEHSLREGIWPLWMRDRGDTKLPGFAPFIRGGTPVRLTMAASSVFGRAGIILAFFRPNYAREWLSIQRELVLRPVIWNLAAT